ncbi:MAG: GTPase ObgE [Firmicutes bacterium]|nr:GTPase ObgE [Bacillota bacterium]
MFVDLVKIIVSAGAGGNGAVSFRREKYVPRGGPDGGDGGNGGNVVLKAVSEKNTLLSFRYKRKFKAEDGVAGRKGNRHGKNGDDLVIEVPVGTIVYAAESNKLLADLDQDEQTFVVAKGGKGGRGNARFANSVNRAPKSAELGLPGEEIELRLELKLMADVGLIGFPNVGKSTLLANVSAARPKIADFPFTTITPNLGVVAAGDDSFVLADIPGLIEGAAQGKGLGHQFLRHVERTRLLIHVLDVSGLSGRDPLADWKAVNAELGEFNDRLASLPQIIVLNKSDIAEAAYVEQVRSKLPGEVFVVSGVTGSGLKELMHHVAGKLQDLPRQALVAPEQSPVIDLTPEEGIIVDKVEDYFVVRGRRVEILAAKTDFENDDAVRNFFRMLKRIGVYDRLRACGIKEGDTVVIADQEFTYE